MATAPIDDLSALSTVTAYLSDWLDTITDRQWVLPTPCGDWTLRELVDHVTGGNWFTIAVLSGTTANDALAQAMACFDRGSPTAQQAIESASQQLDGFQMPRVLEETWHHMAGDLTGGQMLRLRLHDLIVHAWDVHHSLDPNAELPEELARWGLAELGDETSLTVKHFELGGTQHLASDSPAAAYLELFGRRRVG